jgi:hypothetical protein
VNRTSTLVGFVSSSATHQETVPALAGLPSCLSDPSGVTTTATPCLAKFPGFAGSAPRFSQPLSGPGRSWLRGPVSYRLRPWDSLVLEAPPSRGSVPLSEPLRPCRSTRPDRSAGPPKPFARAFQEGPRRHPGVAARTPTRSSHPRPELDRARGSEGSPLPRPTRPTSINPRCRPHEPNSRLRRLPPLENPTPFVLPKGRDSFDLFLSEAFLC